MTGRSDLIQVKKDCKYIIVWFFLFGHGKNRVCPKWSRLQDKMCRIKAQIARHIGKYGEDLQR